MAVSEQAGAAQVAFIIPHFNHSRVIGRQLRSVAGQDVANVEIIVIDDMSGPDERSALIEAVEAFPSVRLILSDKNEGPVAACHHGLDATVALFICFAAADDEVSPDMASTALQALHAHPKAAFCFGDRRSSAPGKEAVVFPLYLKAGYHGPEDMLKLMRQSYFVISTGSCLYRRQLVAQSKAYREELGHFSDTFLNLVLAFRHGAVFVDRPLGTVHTCDTAYSSKMRRSATAQKAIIDSMLLLLKDETYNDVAAAFRSAGVLPEHSLRAVFWLAGNASGRAYLTPRLILTCVAYQLWSVCRDVLPIGWRNRMRKFGARGGDRHALIVSDGE